MFQISHFGYRCRDCFDKSVLKILKALPSATSQCTKEGNLLRLGRQTMTRTCVFHLASDVCGQHVGLQEVVPLV